MTYALGEDRSGYQGIEAWTGDVFGFAKAAEGDSYADPAFPRNWPALRAAGIVRGAYHFFHPALDPVRQAQFFFSTVSAHGGFLPGDVAIADIEIAVGADGAERYGAAPSPARMSLALQQGPLMTPPVGESALAFLEELSGLVGPSCPVVVYTDLYMVQSYIGSCSGYPLFLAFYEPRPPASVAPWRDWTFWQFEQGGGHGGGDADYFNGDLAALLAWRASYDWTEQLMANLPTLQLGSKDAPGQTWHVRRAQALVAGVGRWNSLGSVTAINDDGVFGATTKAAVTAVQRHFGLAQDGVVGPGTWSALIG
jgi:lysozyme